MPKVSVIIPTHNRAELLRSAIISVLNQTFQNFEIIVVDDASRDNTQEVVSSYNDRRLKYIRNEISKGDGVARNAGINNSSGDYIAFLDDDDEWLPEKLEIQIDLLENSSAKVGGVYTGVLNIDRTTRRILGIRIPEKKGDLSKDILVGNFIITSSLILRKECFEKVGLFDESVPFCSDYVMWIRISRQFLFEYIKKPLVKYYIHNNSLSGNHRLVISGIETMLNKYGDFFALNSKGYSYRYIDLGEYYCYNGNVNKGREAFLKAIELHPFDIRPYFNLCLSLLGVSAFKKLKKIKEKVFAFLRRSKIQFGYGI